MTAAILPKFRHLPLRERARERRNQPPSRNIATHAVWPQSCAVNGMRLTNSSSPALRHAWSLLLPFLLLGWNALAASATVQACCSSKAASFAQYVTLQGQRNALGTPGPTGVIIEATVGAIDAIGGQVNARRGQALKHGSAAFIY